MRRDIADGETGVRGDMTMVPPEQLGAAAPHFFLRDVPALPQRRREIIAANRPREMNGGFDDDVRSARVGGLVHPADQESERRRAIRQRGELGVHGVERELGDEDRVGGVAPARPTGVQRIAAPTGMARTRMSPAVPARLIPVSSISFTA